MSYVDAVGTEFDFLDKKFTAWYLGRIRNYVQGNYPSYAYLPDSIMSYPTIFKDTTEYCYVENFLSEFKKQKHVRPFHHERLKPSFTQELIEAFKELRNMVHEPNDSTKKADIIDYGIYTHAKEMGKRMIAMETTEYEIDLTERTDSSNAVAGNMPTQAHSLYEYCMMESGDTVNVLEEYAGGMVSFYKQGDLEGMLSESKSMESRIKQEQPEMEHFDSWQTELTLGRNTMWMPVIITNIQQCSCLIAVGALHLPGEDGLITMLRKEGYKVTPVDIHDKKNAINQ